MDNWAVFDVMSSLLSRRNYKSCPYIFHKHVPVWLIHNPLEKPRATASVAFKKHIGSSTDELTGCPSNHALIIYILLGEAKN